METTTLTPEAILTSLTRIVHPDFGIDVVNLGTIYGIVVENSEATITMAHAVDSLDRQKEIEQVIAQGLMRRHSTLDKVWFDISNDPPWREDFITPEGQLQQQNPMPSLPTETVTAEDIMDTLMFVIDPEVGINIVDLGLIYNVELHGTAAVITMTLTTPGCPLHATIEEAVNRVIETRHPQITEIRVDLVWEPAWDTDMITDAGKRALGW